MNKMKLFEAIGEVDNDILQDAEDFLSERGRPRRTGPRVMWGGLAACLAAAVCAVWALEGTSPQPVMVDPAASENVAVTDFPSVSEPAGSLFPTSPASQAYPTYPASPTTPEGLTRPVVQMNFNDLAKGPEREVTALFALLWEDFVPMTREELLDYFGVTLPIEEIVSGVTAVPMEEDAGFGRGIYRRRESGDVYFDANTFEFELGDGAVGVYVSLDKAFHFPTASWELPGDSLEFTEIKGWELALFRYPDEEGNWWFYAEFLQNGTGYRVSGKNLPEQSFAAVLEALLEERDGGGSGEPRTVWGAVSAGIGHQILTATNPDGSVTTEESWRGPLVVTPEEGAGLEYPSLRVELTEEQAEALAGLSLGDRVKVSFIGEPATIETVWTQQLVGIEIVE